VVLLDERPPHLMIGLAMEPAAASYFSVSMRPRVT
jgi:hypothetical protein